MRWCSAALLGMLLGGSAIAHAATPSSGRADDATPRVTWTGETSGSWLAAQSVKLTDAPCQAPDCDAFALQVGAAGGLTIGLTGNEVVARVRRPDGVATTFTARPDTDGFARLRFDAAAEGRWVIEHFGSGNGPAPYSAFAELAAGPVVEVPVEPQAPSIVRAIELDVPVLRTSRRRRALRVPVSVSRRAEVSAVLRAGTRVVGRATPRRIAGRGRLRVRFTRPLRRGAYALHVTATDGATSTVRTVRVRVRK